MGEEVKVGDSHFILGGKELIVVDQLSNTVDSTFAERVDFSNDLIRSGRAGGLFAVLHQGYSNLFLYDSCMQHIGTIQPDFNMKIRDFFVTIEEAIAVLFENGTLTIYDQSGHVLKDTCLPLRLETSTGEMSLPCTFTATAFTEDFLGCICSDGRGLIMPKLTEQYACTVPGKVSCGMEMDGFAIARRGNASLPPAMYASVGRYRRDLNATCSALVVLQYSEAGCPPYEIDYDDRIVDLAVSDDARLGVILFPEAAVFCSGDFLTARRKIDFKSDWPQRIRFLGGMFVAYGGRHCLLISAAGSYALPESNGYCVFTEVDGARVLTREGVRLLRHAPAPLKEFLDPASKSRQYYGRLQPGPTFVIGDPEKDVADLRADALKVLQEVVKFCRDPALIRRCFRLLISGEEDKSYFKDLLRELEMVIHLRAINLPLTVAQVHALGRSIFVRLCNRSRHFEAIRLAERMGEPAEPITTHWACSLLHAPLPPDEISRQAKQKGVDLVELATLAFQLRLRDVGLALVAANPRAVSLLLQEERYVDALAAAVESSDASAIVRVLAAGRGKIPEAALTQPGVSILAQNLCQLTKPALTGEFAKRITELEKGQCKRHDDELLRQRVKEAGDDIQKVLAATKGMKQRYIYELAVDMRIAKKNALAAALADALEADMRREYDDLRWSALG